MDLSPVELKRAIKTHASRLGFSLVGVTTGESLPHEQEFIKWLDFGRHGEMSYLSTPHSRQYRAHPRRILPECRSVLVLGVRYPVPLPVKSSDLSELAMRGKIASYAWGIDYHEFLPIRLKSLVGFIEEKVGHTVLNRWYTDTGPILERELAQRSGLGWIGKNTCLIHPRLGSYYLLAEILLELEIEPDPPFAYDRCGSCVRCIQACPTSCILPDRTLDARRCISYLTIELKGSIPPELRPLMDGWVFGCDVCQQVCPWNRFATTPADSTFAQLITQPNPDLLSELAQSKVEFNQKYRYSPFSRAKWRGFQRNISVGLGNLSNPSALLALTQLLETNPEPLVRGHAAWAIGQIKGEQTIAILVTAASQEKDPYVLQEIKNAMAKHTWN
jgi:epoxyqueuosine reductase